MKSASKIRKLSWQFSGWNTICSSYLSPSSASCGGTSIIPAPLRNEAKIDELDIRHGGGFEITKDKSTSWISLFSSVCKDNEQNLFKFWLKGNYSTRTWIGKFLSYLKFLHSFQQELQCCLPVIWGRETKQLSQSRLPKMLCSHPSHLWC